MGLRDLEQEAGLGSGHGSQHRKGEGRSMGVCVCVCVCLHTHSSWFDLNLPQPEMATVSASLAWGGVSPLRNMIHRIHIPATSQLCCKLLAHAFACVLIIQSCVAK